MARTNHHRLTVDGKLCSVCGERKPLTLFPGCSKSPDQVSSWCKLCFRVYRLARKQPAAVTS